MLYLSLKFCKYLGIFLVSKVNLAPELYQPMYSGHQDFLILTPWLLETGSLLVGTAHDMVISCHVQMMIMCNHLKVQPIFTFKPVNNNMIESSTENERKNCLLSKPRFKPHTLKKFRVLKMINFYCCAKFIKEVICKPTCPSTH